MRTATAQTPAASPNPRRPNEDPLGAVVSTLVAQIADHVAERLGDHEPSQPTVVDIPKLAVSVAEAAELLGMSSDHFRRHVLPDLRIVRSGRLRLVPVGELETWIDQHKARALEALA